MISSFFLKLIFDIFFIVLAACINPKIKGTVVNPKCHSFFKCGGGSLENEVIIPTNPSDLPREISRWKTIKSSQLSILLRSNTTVGNRSWQFLFGLNICEILLLYLKMFQPTIPVKVNPLSVLAQIWPYGLAVLLTFLVTLGCFPAITVRVSNGQDTTE